MILRSFNRISDLSKPLKDERRGHKLARQSEAKRKQAPQSEANVCRRRRTCNLEKTLPYKLRRTPNNAHNTQHKLGVAFSYIERNYYYYYYYYLFLNHVTCLAPRYKSEYFQYDLCILYCFVAFGDRGGGREGGIAWEPINS